MRKKKTKKKKRRKVSRSFLEDLVLFVIYVQLIFILDKNESERKLYFQLIYPTSLVPQIFRLYSFYTSDLFFTSTGHSFHFNIYDVWLAEIGLPTRKTYTRVSLPFTKVSFERKPFSVNLSGEMYFLRLN